MTSAADRFSDQPDELQHDLLRRSFTMRVETTRWPRWQQGWPVAVHGRLPDGQPWAIVFGLDAEGPAVDFSVSTSRWNVGIHQARHIGTRGARDGELNQDHGGGVRSLCWLTGIAVEELQLDTDQGSLPVLEMYDSEQLGVRVYFTVIEDEAVILRAARHIDGDGRELAVEDLAWAQERFESDRARQREGPQPGTKEFLAQKRAELGPGAPDRT